MIRRLDFWIGTHLFHPPIIWLCQRTGLTQHAIASYAWLAATFTLVMRMHADGIGGIVFTIVVSLTALLQSILVGLLPDMPRQPAYLFRLILWALTSLNVLDLAFRPDIAGDTDCRWALAWDALALIGEYAKTITTIPPRKRRERRTTAKEAFS